MQRITKSRKKRRVQVLWLLRITKSCQNTWSVGTSWSNGWSWSTRAIERLDMTAIHKPTSQRFEIPAPVVVYTDFESAIDDNYKHKPVMLSCLAVSRIPAIQTHLRVFHAPHEKKRDSLLHRIPVAIANECEEGPLRWITHSKALPRSIEIIAPQSWFLLSRKTNNGEIDEILEKDFLDAFPKLSITHMWQVNTRQGRETRAPSRLDSTSAFVAPNATHLHLLHQMQPATLVQQEELSITSVFPQWVALRLHVHHEAHRDDAWEPRSHSNHWRQGNADRI